MMPPYGAAARHGAARRERAPRVRLCLSVRDERYRVNEY